MSDENDSWLEGIGVDVSGIVGSVQETVNSGIDSVVETAAGASETAGGYYEGASDWASGAYDQASSAASGAYESASSAASQAADSAENAYEGAADWASGAYEQASSAASGAYETASDAASSAYDSASEGASQAADAASGAWDSATDAAGEVWDQAADIASDPVGAVSDAASDVSDAASGAWDWASDMASSAGEVVDEGAGGIADDAFAFLDSDQSEEELLGFSAQEEEPVTDFDASALLAQLTGVPATKKDVAGEPNPRADAAPTGFEGPPRSDQDKATIDGLSTVEKTATDREKEDSDALSKAMEKVASAALKKFMETADGKAIKAAAEKELEKIPPLVVFGVPAAVIASATVGLAATSGEFPVTESPDIPLPFKLGPVAVSAKVTWKGPVDKPTESKVFFTFEIPLGKDEPRPSRQQENLGGASGSGTSGELRPPAKQGAAVVAADFDDGKMSVDQVVKAVAKHSEPVPGSGLIRVAYFFDGVTMDADAAQLRAEEWRKAIEQMVSKKYRVTASVHFKATGGLVGGFSGLGTHDIAIIYTPPGR